MRETNHVGSFHLKRVTDGAAGGSYVADQRYYVTADGTRAVPEGDPAANRLLVVAGGKLPEAVARQYGLLPGPTPEPETAPPAPAAKAVPAPAGDKAVRPGANKARAL